MFKVGDKVVRISSDVELFPVGQVAIIEEIGDYADGAWVITSEGVNYYSYYSNIALKKNLYETLQLFEEEFQKGLE